MLPSPGTSQFLPHLLLHIDEVFENTSGETWSFDTVLFSTLLLARIVDRGGVIIDIASRGGSTSKRERREDAAKVIACVKAISECIFGLSTVQSHLGHSTSPRDLPYHLLLNAPTPPSPRKSKRGHRPANPRVSSFATNTTGSRYVSALPSPAANSTSKADTPGFYIPSGNVTAATTPGVTPKPSLFLQPWSTESPGPSSSGGYPPAIVPSDQQNSPFPLEGHRAPHAAPSPSVPDVVILDGLEHCSSPTWIKLAEILTSNRIGLPRGKRKSPLMGEVETLAPESTAIVDAVENTWEPKGLDSSGMMLIWVRDEDYAENCPGWLLDYFACSSVIMPEALQMPPPELHHQDIISQEYIASLTALLAYTHIHPTLQMHISNLQSAVSGHPRLGSCITGRAVTALPQFIRAHRLLSGPFDLPPGWQAVLMSEEDDDAKRDKFGLGGGKGGVDSWAALAGEEPSIRDLAKRAALSLPQKRATGVEDIEEWEGEDWYALPINARAAFELCTRHRVRYREERGEVMWLLKGNAAGLVHQLPEGEVGEMPGSANGAAQSLREVRKRREEVDRILSEIQRVV